MAGHVRYVHLVSDATGATLQGLTEAGLSQFEHVEVRKKLWPQVRTLRQMERVIEDLELHGGMVLYTLVDQSLIMRLEEACLALHLPCVAVMRPILEGLTGFLGSEPVGQPGLQHKLDEFYFARMEAIDFAMGFDDGQNLEGIETADVILVGVSRTSKTPTCVYLARQGIRAANIPLVREVGFPEDVLHLKKPLFVGLTESVDRLIELRSSRLKVDQKYGLSGNSYVDPEKVEEEVQWARKFFRSHEWPVIDVTKRSVEETAAAVMVLLQQRREEEDLAK
ncbi:MAG TPA: pyruvate, water dikinase regulatory protein [Alphaproteobacteria bacterium]|nr:pyruvate, water dikinase regulatory protein [Alphaproteobacteria bacterium]HNS45066.1 pyruvate, water dikinase regulatory protein [Alphaproteobacteria bacterium]